MTHTRHSRTNVGSIGGAARLLLLVVAMGTALLVFACTDEPVGSEPGMVLEFSSLSGRFVANRPVTFVPNRFWEVDKESKVWSFRGWASLVVHIDEVRSGRPLRFRLVPDDTTSRMHFKATWDQEMLGKSAVAAGDGVILNIPGHKVTAGLHRLKVGRVQSADDEALREIADCRFTAIEIGAGKGQHLNPDHHRRYELTRAFLEDGVAGVSKERHGGLLVAGRQMVRTRVETAADTEVSFSVSAFFAPKTRFVLSVDGTEHHVEADAETAELKVALGEGVHELTLTADGPEQGLYLWGAPSLMQKSGPRRGPVILVTLDTTRKDALSIYGGDEKATPAIARFAEGATVYDHAWSTSPWTLPSHASLFTGLYPTRHGAGVSQTRLDIPFPTLAESAQTAGFRTAGFSGGALSASRWGLARGFGLYRDPDKFETKGDRQTEYVVDFIDGHADEPFFLFVNYFDPHAMYNAPAEFQELFGVGVLRERLADTEVWNKVSQGDPAVWRAVINGEVEPTQDALDYLEAAYLAEVAYMDHQIGRLISSLVEHDLYDRSTIILVADHGEFLGEDGFFSHACRLDPELTEIPLVIKWPGQTLPGRDDRLISQVDLFGSVLDALGVESSSRDGIPIRAENRDIFDERSTIFMEEHENRIHPLFKNMTIAPHIYGLQQRDWRQLVWNGGDLCYDRQGRAWREAGCEVGWQQRLKDLAAVAALPVETDLSGGDVGLTDEMREHLEALGYIR